MPEVENVLALFRTQKDLTVDMAGEVREAKASFQSLMFGFAASVVLVYIVLVAQFNLLWVPLLAMVSVPLSVIGVTLGLGVTGHTLNLMSGQGLMILAGIVVNNSLMLLEFIQQRRAAGCSAEDAVRQSARARVRPILITVIGNGAGLVMSTLDVVAKAGEGLPGSPRPANFLDIGGGASAEVMANGLDIIISDDQVKSVLVNVFGGITACSEVAKGIIDALVMLGDRATKPIVVRLDGNAVEVGRHMLLEAAHPLVQLQDTMDAAARRAAELAISERGSDVDLA